MSEVEAPARRIIVDITANGLEARVSIKPGDAMSGRLLRLELTRAGVTHGIDEYAVASLEEHLRRPESEARSTLVAWGSRAVPGRDGRLDLDVELGPSVGARRDDGSMDFSERGLIKPVKAGQQLGRYHRPTAGEAGITVKGEAIVPQAGVDHLPELGEGLSLDEAGNLVVEHDGALVRQTKGLAVTDFCRHAGNVDLRSGHLEMRGGLSIVGDVCQGFKAKATGDIEVRGCVDGGSVHANANLIVRGMVFGRGGGCVSAGENAVMRGGQSARVWAGGRLELQRDAVSCTLEGVDVIVGGQVLGGSIEAEISVLVQEAGSAEGGTTTLAAGILLTNRADDVRAALAEVKAGRLGARRRATLRGEAGSRAKGGRSVRTEGGSVKALARKRERRRRERELLALARIEIVGQAWPDVTIRLGKQTMNLTGVARQTRFRHDQKSNRIIAESLKT